MENVANKHNSIDFVILLGDNFYNSGVPSEYDSLWTNRFEEMYGTPHLLGIPFYAVLGNHDYRGNIQAQLNYDLKDLGTNRWTLPKRHYVRDFGRTADGDLLSRIVFIDTNADEDYNQKQLETLSKAFADTDDMPIWKIVVGHHPIYNYGHHGETESLQTWLLPALKAHKVDIYLSGHEHNQQVIRHNGEPLYIISGGGGKHLHDIKRTDRNLVYSAVTHGFLKVTVDSHSLNAELFNDQAVCTFHTSLKHSSEPEIHESIAQDSSHMSNSGFLGEVVNATP